MIRSKCPIAGSGLLAVLFTITLVTILVGAVLSVTNSHVAVTKRNADRASAIAYADGVMESLFDQWRQAMISVTNATDRTDGLSNASLTAVLAAPAGDVLPPPPGVTLASWSVTARTPLLAPTTKSNGRPVPENGTASRMRVRLHYLAVVNVNFATASGPRTVTLQRTFVRSGRNLFDNFYFGTQPVVEFHPGAPMYVSGTCYIDGDLYTGKNDLHFTKDVTYMRTHTNDFHPDDPRPEAPNIADGGFDDNWDINNPPHIGNAQKLFDTPVSELEQAFLDHPNSNDANADGNSNNDGYRELIEEQESVGSSNPDPLQLDAGTSERLSKNADYRIYVDAANVLTVKKGASETPLSPSSSEYLAISSAITTNQAIADKREGSNVRLVSIDVDKVRTAYNSSAISDNAGDGDGLLFYVQDKSDGTSVSSNIVNSASGSSTPVTSIDRRGVRLTNGAFLPGTKRPTESSVQGIVKGFTLVSPNAVYIQGDYNTGTNGVNMPPSNTATSYTPPLDNPDPYATGYDRVASAVVGDAVNILSNAWNDGNSTLPTNSRAATNTTINAAIVSGNVPTGTDGSYSGGIENFTRFHETWSGDYLTIYGAIASLFDSAQATGPWSRAQYSPPNRRWYYDTLLQDNNPPGFRAARSYERGPWVQR
jgi:hypothetical protein